MDDSSQQNSPWATLVNNTHGETLDRKLSWGKSSQQTLKGRIESVKFTRGDSGQQNSHGATLVNKTLMGQL